MPEWVVTWKTEMGKQLQVFTDAKDADRFKRLLEQSYQKASIKKQRKGTYKKMIEKKK